MAIINKDLESLMSNEIAGLGFCFLGLELEGQDHNKLLRVYVDTCNNSHEGKINNIDDQQIFYSNNSSSQVNLIKAGITIEDCSKISRHLHKFMSTISNLNASNYILEVSSPGLDRKLFNLSQFVNQVGKEIKIRLRIPLDGKFNLGGILRNVDCNLNKVFVEVDKQEVCLDYDNIAKANLVYRNCN